MSKNNKKYNNLVDLIKFIAALLVIFSHSFSLSSGSKDYLARISPNASFGSLAVAIFFSFSGYYVTKSILKNDKKFLLKRIKRIFPELFVVTFLTIFVVGPIFTNLSLSSYFLKRETYFYFINAFLVPYHTLPGVFTKNIYGSTVNGALWTLSVEFLCYFYIWIIKKLGLLTKQKITLLFPIILFFSLFGYIIMKKMGIKVIMTIIRPFLIFNFSSLLFFYKEKINWHSLVLLICSFFAFLILKNAILYDIILVLILTTALCYLANSVFINNSLLSMMGKISFAIYLVGFIVQQCVISLYGGVMNSYINFIIATPISIILAIIVYSFTNFLNKYFIETE